MKKLVLHKPLPTDGSWWVTDRESFYHYIHDEANVARMSRGRCASFVPGVERFGMGDRESSSRRPTTYLLATRDHGPLEQAS